MKHLLFSIIYLSIINLGFSQVSYWKRTNIALKTQVNKNIKLNSPDNVLFHLNLNKVKKILQNSVIKEKSFKSDSSIILSIPNEQGEMESFKIIDANILHPDLASKYPDINSYIGLGIDDPSAIVRFSISSYGFQSMRLSGKSKTIFIEPHSITQSVYKIYSKDDIIEIPEKFECLVKENFNSDVFTKKQINNKKNHDGKLRVFRLALACTGEYAQFHLKKQGINSNESNDVKKGVVLAAMNTAMTRVNAIFERDLGITMQIIPNNTDIIFLDPDTDHFEPNKTPSLEICQTVCDNKIGSTNYDIGHTFNAYSGGLASLRSPCTSNKAKGTSGQWKPIGIYFETTVMHEMGHQFGAGHSFNNSCDNNRSLSSSVEPGSGTTIMGYAGLCDPYIQFSRDLYFHSFNIQQMWNTITNGNSTCGSIRNTGNNVPIANAGLDYTIPASTPFILKGYGEDSDRNNTLTYCWEQINGGIVEMPPSSNSTIGPAFRSIIPSLSKNRYMPSLSTVLNGLTSSIWEVVSTVSRKMNFRFIVRDNVIGGAATASDDMVITVTDKAGPFIVKYPNVLVRWPVGSNQTVKWDVAGTTANGINTADVDILLSTDGGKTYPIILASSVPNIGNYDITVPNQTGNQNRIMVRASKNIFFDISDKNFEITTNLSVEENNFNELLYYPNPVKDKLHLSLNILDLSQNITIKLYDLNGKLVYSKSQQPVSNFTKSLNLKKLSSELYLMEISQGKQKKLIKILIL